MKVAADNKELIPEFFFDPAILINSERAELGTDHLQQPVNHVEIPPWASTPRDFILKHNRALETANIEHWVDLVFGHAQRGPQAHQNLNLYQSHIYTQEDLKSLSSV